jgi:hypothetical protein
MKAAKRRQKLPSGPPINALVEFSYKLQRHGGEEGFLTEAQRKNLRLFARQRVCLLSPASRSLPQGEVADNRRL